MRDFGGVRGTALRARHGLGRGRLAALELRHRTTGAGMCARRGDAVGAQFLARLVGHPLGGPGGRELAYHPAWHALREQHGTDVVADLVHRRAAAVGGGDDHLDLAVGAAAQGAQDAHLAQGDDGDFGVGELVQGLPQGGEVWLPLPQGGRGLGWGLGGLHGGAVAPHHHLHPTKQSFAGAPRPLPRGGEGAKPETQKRGHHTAPGCARARLCISPSR